MTTETMTLDELYANVERWSKKRGILAQSTYEKQVQKYFSERAELFTTNDVEDAYGDMMVCLINAELLHETQTIDNFDKLKRDRSTSLIEYSLMIGSVRIAIKLLNEACSAATGDAERCYAKAWNDIKNRVGLMIDGTYVKWDNLTQAQRVEVARTGQLQDEGVNLDHCRSFCSDDEWREISAVEQEVNEG